ncbi:MAG: extracellular solute-binding protein [Chloroflexi bacterium]|nr:extracellular solute-binding protein [Chloroflexota bacterium]
MITKIVLVAVLGFSLISLSCISARAPAPLTDGPEATIVEATVPQEAWQRDWQKTLAAARREGKLSIYGGGDSVERQMESKAFKDQFGVDIEWTTGASTQVAQKLLTERRAGLYIADLLLTGAPAVIRFVKPAGALEPIRPLLVLPEVLDERVWDGGRLPFLDKEQSYVISPLLAATGHIVINTTMAKPEELASYNNLLEPRWKGKIIFGDPTTGLGSTVNIFIFLYDTLGPDFLRKFADNSPVLLRDERLAADWVAHGKYAMLLGIGSDGVNEYVKAGAPLKLVVPREGGILNPGGPMALINRAPHPNAAKVFVNWLMSKEGSHLYSLATSKQSARLDVPTDNIAPDNLRNPAIKYTINNMEDSLLQYPAYIEKAKEIFAPLLK